MKMISVFLALTCIFLMADVLRAQAQFEVAKNYCSQTVEKVSEKAHDIFESCKLSWQGWRDYIKGWFYEPQAQTLAQQDVATQGITNDDDDEDDLSDNNAKCNNFKGATYDECIDNETFFAENFYRPQTIGA